MRAFAVATFATVAVAVAATFGTAAAADRPTMLAPLGAPPIPPDNPQTPEKIELGKMLFFDGRLSGNGAMPCVACHLPDAGWGFPDRISLGYPGTAHWRNSHTVVNAAYLSKLFWAGASGSLEGQARSAARGGVAGNGEDDMMEARLAFVPEYRERFKDVFGDEWPLIRNAYRAIASFQRTLIHNDTPFDQYMRGDDDAISDQQKRGLDLFVGKANCAACHSGALLTDEKYYNLGVPPYEGWETDALAQITFRFEQYSKGVTQELYREIKDDAGLYYRTKQKNDAGKFRTAPLRYIAYTAPYMHNGMIETLDDVIDFYDAGGGANDFAANKTSVLKPLGLSDAEKADLRAFLDALSGEELMLEEPDLPEYEPLPPVAGD